MYISRVPKEFEARLLLLTLALYRITDFFSAEESIRRHIREKANQILEETIECGYIRDSSRVALSLVAKVAAIKRYFEIAQSLNVVDPINFRVLAREYDIVSNFFSKEFEETNLLHTEKEGEKQDMHSLFLSRMNYKNIWKREGMVQERVSDTHPMNMRENPHAEEGEEYIQNDPYEMPLFLNERQRKIIEYIRNATRARISDFYSFFNDISTKTIQRDLQDLVGRNILKKEGEKRGTFYIRNNVH